MIAIGILSPCRQDRASMNNEFRRWLAHREVKWSCRKSNSGESGAAAARVRIGRRAWRGGATERSGVELPGIEPGSPDLGMGLLRA